MAAKAHQKMITLAVTAAVSGMASSLLGSGATGAIAGVLGGVCQNLLSDLLGPRVSGAVLTPEQLVRNHDLHQLVASSIVSTLLAAASDSPAARSLARAAGDAWKRRPAETDTVAQLDETAVTSLFAHGDSQFGDLRALTPEQWREFLRLVAAEHRIDVDGTLLNSLATSLHERLPEVIRNTVKQDFLGHTDAQGRGFASLQLALMGRLVEGVEQLLTRPAESSAEILDALARIERSVGDRTGYHSKRLRGREAAVMNEVVAKIESIRPRIEKRLDEVRRAIEAEGLRSASRDAKTHHRLASVFCGVIAVAAMVAAGLWVAKDTRRGVTNTQKAIDALLGSPSDSQFLLVPKGADRLAGDDGRSLFEQRLEARRSIRIEHMNLGGALQRVASEYFITIDSPVGPDSDDGFDITTRLDNATVLDALDDIASQVDATLAAAGFSARDAQRKNPIAERVLEAHRIRLGSLCELRPDICATYDLELQRSEEVLLTEMPLVEVVDCLAGAFDVWIECIELPQEVAECGLTIKRGDANGVELLDRVCESASLQTGYLVTWAFTPDGRTIEIRAK